MNVEQLKIAHSTHGYNNYSISCKFKFLYKSMYQYLLSSSRMPLVNYVQRPDEACKYHDTCFWQRFIQNIKSRFDCIVSFLFFQVRRITKGRHRHIYCSLDLSSLIWFYLFPREEKQTLLTPDYLLYDAYVLPCHNITSANTDTINQFYRSLVSEPEHEIGIIN